MNIKFDKKRCFNVNKGRNGESCCPIAGSTLLDQKKSTRCCFLPDTLASPPGRGVICKCGLPAEFVQAYCLTVLCEVYILFEFIRYTHVVKSYHSMTRADGS